MEDGKTTAAVNFHVHRQKPSLSKMQGMQSQAPVGGPVIPPPKFKPMAPVATQWTYVAMEGVAAHVLGAGLAGAAAEAGLIMRGASMPLLGRAGAVGGMSSLGSSLGLIIGRMLSRRTFSVFGALGNFCDVTVGSSLTATDLIVSAVLAFVSGAAVSAAVESYQRSRLIQGKLGFDPVSRALLVGAAVALSQLAANRFTPKVARVVFGCSGSKMIGTAMAATAPPAAR